MQTEPEFTAILKRGHGYWDVTQYPYGGCFRRAACDTPCKVIGTAGKYSWERKVRFDDGRIGVASLQSGLVIQH